MPFPGDGAVSEGGGADVVLGTELRMSALRTLMDAAGAALHGQLEAAYRQAPVGTFGGGVNEVQREIIALAVLGMPRTPR
jgi:alkylation response protein AidB-like acyl-CoA dehydrogenase